MASMILDAAKRKGYTGSRICELVNERGVRCHINRFREAVKDKPKRTANETLIAETAWDIVRKLPERDAQGSVFAERARMNGESIKSVWEYYQSTREKKYSYGSFCRAVRRPAVPFEVELAREADLCLIEMVAKRSP